MRCLQILTTPVGKSHGLAAMRVADAVRKSLGGHTMAEVGVSTSIGVRAPELCVEIVSASDALPKLREKAMAYVNDPQRRFGFAVRLSLCPRSAVARSHVHEGHRSGYTDGSVGA